MQYIKSKNEQASDMMWDAGLGGGGSFVCCSCDKDHSLPHDLTEEEYENAENFYYIILDGQNFVYGCDGCARKLLRYESFIWQNRDHIRRYLKTRIDQEKAWADQEDLMNKLAGI